MNRHLLTFAGTALLVAAGGLAMMATLQANRKLALSPPLLPGKSEQRVSASEQATKDSTGKSSAKEAKVLVEHWLAGLKGDRNLRLPAEVQEACKQLGHDATERFLQDLFQGWRPGIPRLGFSLQDPRLAMLHTALLERLGELDPGALRNFPTPTDFNHDWLPVAGFFKGVASKDGERAINLLRAWLPEDKRQLREAIMGPLFEGWAASDPAAAWTWLSETNAFEPGVTTAAKGYFAGLGQAKWENFPDKIKPFDQGTRGKFTSQGPVLRMELAKRWIQEDPAAALEYYDKASSEARTIRTAYDPEQRGMDRDVIHLSQIAAPWLESDSRCLEKLREVLANTSSRFRGIDPDEVLAAIAFGSSNPEELRAKAKAQIRDLAGAERRQAERQEAASDTVEWRAGAKGLRSE